MRPHKISCLARPYRGRKEMDDLATPLRARRTSAASAKPAASWLIQAVKNSFGACWLKRSLHPEKRNGSAGRCRRDEFEDRADFSRHRSSYDLGVVVRGRDSLLSFRLWLRVNFYKTQSEHNESADHPKLSVRTDVADPGLDHKRTSNLAARGG